MSKKMKDIILLISLILIVLMMMSPTCAEDNDSTIDSSISDDSMLNNNRATHVINGSKFSDIKNYLNGYVNPGDIIYLGNRSYENDNGLNGINVNKNNIDIRWSY